MLIYAFSITLTNKLSHIPLDNLASVLASKGAITMRSAHRLNSMCSIGSLTFFQSYQEITWRFESHKTASHGMHIRQDGRDSLLGKCSNYIVVHVEYLLEQILTEINLKFTNFYGSTCKQRQNFLSWKNNNFNNKWVSGPGFIQKKKKKKLKLRFSQILEFSSNFQF